MDPGPKYNTQIHLGKKTINMKNTPNYSIQNTNIPDHMHEVVKHAKEVPAPGKYAIQKSDRIVGCVRLDEAKKNFLEEAQFLGQQTPHAYNEVPLQLYKSPRASVVQMGALVHQEKPRRADAIECNEPIGPGYYQPEPAFQKKSNVPTPRTFSFIKSPKRMFMDDVIAKAKDVPAAGMYSPEKAEARLCRRITRTVPGWFR